MATRTGRKGTPTMASSTSSFSSSHETSSASGTRSPLSPTRISRFAEKVEMQNLNDRLAVYMDTVRSLEKENSRLVKQVEISQETITKEKTSLKSMYEQELSDARQLLDTVASERARSEIENKHLREENEDLKSMLDKSTKECRKLETNLNVVEHRLTDLQLKYNKAAADQKKHDEDQREIEKLKKIIESQKKMVENETLARVDVENKLQSLKEEAQFKQQIYESEVKELRYKKREEISEIDGRLTVEYEDKLQAALKELRDQYEQQLLANREEIIQLYEGKIRNLQDYHGRNLAANTAAVEELRSIQLRYDSASSQLSALEQANTSLNARVKDLERQLQMERTRNTERLISVETELARTREEMTNQLKEYQDLMDIKVALDSEISAYRKLLEFEEERLKITPALINTPPARRGTPLRRAAPKVAKRRRLLAEEAERFEVVRIANNDIEVSDVDPEGKFVQLYNKSEKEIALGGWTIKHEAAGKESSFKLHRSVKIEPNGNVTVWSSDASHAHEPPLHIVTRQKWSVGDPSKTTLYNNDGEEEAVRTRNKVESSYRQEFDDETDSADPQKEQCAIM